MMEETNEKDVFNGVSETRRWGKKWSFSAQDMQTALDYVKAGKSIREAARITNVPYATTRRYWLKQKETATTSQQNIEYLEMPSSCPSSPIEPRLKSILKKIPTVSEPDQPLQNKFTEKQEIELANLFNGKNGTECRRIAYEKAFKWKVLLHKTWDNEKMADIYWITNFQKRLPDLLEKQYKNNQKVLSQEGTSKYVNSNLSKVMNTTSSNNILGLSSPTRRPSESSELDSFGNDSTDDDPDLDIVKVEGNNYVNNRRQNNIPTWDKKIATIFSERRKRKRKNSTNISMRNNVEDIKVFTIDRFPNQPLENRNFSLSQNENDVDRSESNQQDKRHSLPELSNHNNQSSHNHRQIYKEIDGNVDKRPENLHMSDDNDDEDTDDSNGTSHSHKSKKLKISDNKKKKMFRGMKAACQQELDADELFLLSLLPAFKSIPERDKTRAKIKLLEVLDGF